MDTPFITLLFKSKLSRRRFLLESASTKQLQPIIDFIVKINKWGIVLTKSEGKSLSPYVRALMSVIRDNSKIKTILLQYDQIIPKLFEIHLRHQ